jgi:hypothetical protein
MPIKVEKKPAPFLMILVLIAAVMPISLTAVGIEFHPTHTISSVIKTYGKAISFVGCTYQPVLVSEVIALINELPCEGPNPGPQSSPAQHQLACNPEQITIDEEIRLQNATSPESLNHVNVDMKMVGISPLRVKRVVANCSDNEIPIQPSAEVLEVAFAQVLEIPQRIVTRNAILPGYEMSKITKPVFSTRQANDYAHLVKASLSSGTKRTIQLEQEEQRVRAEKIRVWTINCNFKALKTLYESEELKPARAGKKTQAETAPLPLIMPRVFESNFSEF